MLIQESAPKRLIKILSRRRNPVDSSLIAIMVMLLSTGLLVLFSATYYAAKENPLAEITKQLIGVALGTAACMVTSRIPYRFWRQTWVVVTGLCVSAVLLILVIIPGIGVYINGSRRWLSLGGLSFQPSELAKGTMILATAQILSAMQREDGSGTDPKAMK